jgi:hypothetical protein
VDEPVRWTIKVSKETDRAVRSFLAQRGNKKGDLARFIEDAVRWRVLDTTVAEIKANNSALAPEAIETAIDEALAAVRAQHLHQLG